MYETEKQRQDSIQFDQLVLGINQLRNQERNSSIKSITSPSISPSPRRATQPVNSHSGSGSNGVTQISNEKTPDQYNRSKSGEQATSSNEVNSGKTPKQVAEMQTEKVYCTDFSTQLHKKPLFSNNLANKKDEILQKLESQTQSQAQTPNMIGEKALEVANGTQKVELSQKLI